MSSRRNFLKLGILGGLGLSQFKLFSNTKAFRNDVNENFKPKPLMISTWNHGLQANEAGWEILAAGGSALDAVEAGARIVESDPAVTSVGLGGLPDAEGKVTLDACIMKGDGSCGAVLALEQIEHPISVAKAVMEKTPHVMFAGQGAQDFAVEQGFELVDLLTPEAKAAWEKWKEESKYQPEINSENHDTIGLLAMDANGDLAGACTTSGMAYKMPGRIGDSPIIGAGLFVDNEVGACTATGVGEAIVKVAGSAMIVEMMRQGISPQEACAEAVRRIKVIYKGNIDNLQVAFLAMDKKGNVGSFAMYEGFNYALRDAKEAELIDSRYHKKWN
jgi:isoaspartyl peptidase/L-asparaginase-like protein (Ntn-hydrolase superfamily)